MNKKYTIITLILISIIIFSFFIMQKNTNNLFCGDSIIKQDKDLKEDKLSETEKFEKYKISDTYTGKMSDINLKNEKANLYRTRLREEIRKNGINFAGHYSIVSVGMTGQGNNYFIVDLITGDTYPFIYEATFLTFQKDSNLLIMNSKEAIQNYRANVKYESDKCITTGVPGIYYSDLRPVYFVWENNGLKIIGPENPILIEDQFWRN